LQTFEAFSLERSLGVSYSRLDFPFSIWIFDPAWESNRAVVGQHVAIERIQDGIVDVRDQYTLAQIIQDNNACAAT
jgi:hypothetical protein